jgi:hypothetical protein
MKRIILGGAAATLVAGVAAMYSSTAALAVVTSTWTVDAYEQWNEGEAEQAFLTSLGEVRPGWATERVDLELDGVWAQLRAADGTMILGTDDDGTIYTVRGDKVKKVVSLADAIAVVSLAQTSDGALYAGTMPGGQIWKIDVAGGKASKLVELADVETVWALAMAPGDRTLYAGTGPEGKLFKVDVRSGKAEVAFETGDKRIMALVASRDGGIWIGTSDQALVYRHDPERGTTRAMADFAGNEITALAEIDGGVVALANDFKEPTTSGVKTKAAVEKAAKEPKEGEKAEMPRTGSQPGADTPERPGEDAPRKGKRTGKGALYRVWGDGRLRQLHALTATYFSAVAVDDKGRIFAGAGEEGRIYLIDTDESVSTAYDVEERLITSMLWVGKQGLTFTTGDAAAFYRTTGPARDASYESEVFDAKNPSRFGKIVWSGDGKVTIETRTGNTAKPGKGWSEWQTPGQIGRRGGLRQAGGIASPTGRYVQFRARFNGDADAVLRQVSVYYLPYNEPTRVTEVDVETTTGDGLVTMKDGVTQPRSPVIKLSWKVDNPDGDETVYTLAVRREGEVIWREINTGKNALTATSYQWNTETFPDGWYRLRVSASDRRQNAADRAMQTHRTTPLFLVDNEKPAIDGITVKYPAVSARATDSMSVIAEMAYSIDDGPWRVGDTRDGIYDDLSEMLTITLPDDLKPGIHTLAIRVADEAGNIGSASVTFRVR